MKLYKNVDIKDLKSILEKGILSLDASGNDNWNEGHRSNNATDKVYLFKPKNAGDSFPHYGAALLECETNAVYNVMSENDTNDGKYDEYITDYVKPEEIINVYIPEGFISLVPESIADKVTPCKLSAKVYDDYGYIEATEDIIARFYKTANAYSADSFNFFRGMNENRTMIDLYEVKYLF